jgi:hypothetical protein
MSAIVNAAAVQISPVLCSRQGTVEKVVRKIHELGKQGVRFATFPETLVPYYPYFSFVQSALEFMTGKEYQHLLEESVTIPSAETRAIGEAAKAANVVVSIGVNERNGGTIYNTQLLFDADGTLIQRRRKLTPTFHERMIWGEGDARACEPSTAPLGASGSSPAGSTSCRWRATPSSPAVNRFTRPCIPDRPSVRRLRIRRKSASASTPWNPLASWLTPRRGSMPISRPRS